LLLVDIIIHREGELLTNPPSPGGRELEGGGSLERMP